MSVAFQTVPHQHLTNLGFLGKCTKKKHCFFSGPAQAQSFHSNCNTCGSVSRPLLTLTGNCCKFSNISSAHADPGIEESWGSCSQPAGSGTGAPGFQGDRAQVCLVSMVTAHRCAWFPLMSSHHLASGSK